MKSLASACAAGLAVAHLSILFCAGCEVTPEKIQIWKESENGAPKLRAAVRDTDQALRIRVLAADALAELAHYDPLITDLQSLQGADRSALQAALVQSLRARMQGVNAQSTTRVQEQAKDALFTLRGAFDAGQRSAVDLDVLRWVLADWGRRRGGDHSGEKIATTIGAPGIPLIVAALDADPGMVAAFAPLLRKTASAAQREQAGAKIIALLGLQQAGKCARCPERSALLEGLGRLGAANGRAHLLGVAVSGTGEPRDEALAALALCADESVVDPMLALAGNAREPGEVRDAAVTVVEKVGGARTLQALAGLLGHQEKLLRYRAGEALIACCGAQGVAKLLESLPSRYAYAEEDVKDFIEKDLRELGERALPPLRATLTSQSWWLPHVIAIELLGDLGTKDDLPRLTKAMDDQTRVPWGKGDTVGNRARAALERLKKRLSAM